jgi:hypothetical protein
MLIINYFRKYGVEDERDGIGKEYLPDSERDDRSQSGTIRRADAN